MGGRTDGANSGIRRSCNGFLFPRHCRKRAQELQIHHTRTTTNTPAAIGMLASNRRHARPPGGEGVSSPGKPNSGTGLNNCRKPSARRRSTGSPPPCAKAVRLGLSRPKIYLAIGIAASASSVARVLVRSAPLARSPLLVVLRHHDVGAGRKRRSG